MTFIHVLVAGLTTKALCTLACESAKEAAALTAIDAWAGRTRIACSLAVATRPSGPTNARVGFPLVYARTATATWFRCALICGYLAVAPNEAWATFALVSPRLVHVMGVLWGTRLFGTGGGVASSVFAVASA